MSKLRPKLYLSVFTSSTNDGVALDGWAHGNRPCVPRGVCTVIPTMPCLSVVAVLPHCRRHVAIVASCRLQHRSHFPRPSPQGVPYVPSFGAFVKSCGVKKGAAVGLYTSKWYTEAEHKQRLRRQPSAQFSRYEVNFKAVPHQPDDAQGPPYP